MTRSKAVAMLRLPATPTCIWIGGLLLWAAGLVEDRRTTGDGWGVLAMLVGVFVMVSATLIHRRRVLCGRPAAERFVRLVVVFAGCGATVVSLAVLAIAPSAPLLGAPLIVLGLAMVLWTFPSLSSRLARL